MARPAYLLTLAIATISLFGCGADKTPLSPSAPSFEAQSPVLCQENPWLCVPVNGTIHDGTGDGVVQSAADDPTPGANGVWLGDMVSARFCYADYNSFVNDQDHDWLDDNCEFQLARAFAPALAMNPQDDCPAGEPYWAAKYFPNSAYGWGEFVRIAYMPSYYIDCGAFGTGHLGDSEFMMLSVQYNTSTQHWEIRNAYLSAHAGVWGGDSSDWPSLSDIQYPVWPLAHPRIWVARAKHANYPSKRLCNVGGFAGLDDCEGNVSMGRIRVYPNRNVGSRFMDWFPNGVMSENTVYRYDDAREYYYTRNNFRGWQALAEGVTPYADFLVGPTFECFMYTLGYCYWGPGPNPPASTTMTGVIHGPSNVVRGVSATWTSFVTGGQLPYSAEWWRQYASEPTPTLVGTSNSGSYPFTGGSWTFIPDRCETFTLRMKLTSATQQLYWTWTFAVAVACPDPLANSIARDGDYFTASPTGGQTPYASSYWEACGLDCDGGGGGDLAPAAGGGVRPNTIAHGWQFLSTDWTVYWTQHQRWLRSTITDSNGQQAVATYFLQ